jgi:hypothetical protein
MLFCLFWIGFYQVENALYFMPGRGERVLFGGKLEKGNFLNNKTRTMFENYSLAQKKMVIIILGILVIVLAILNRLFLQNTVMSAIIVVLIIVFLLGLLLFSIHSRSTTFKPRRRTQKIVLKRKRFVHWN